jgi:hypothetical protein
MPCKQQSNIPTVYQTHVFAKLHEQNEHWLHLKILLNSNEIGKDWMQWRFLQSSWCWVQSFFWQVMQMHLQAWALLLEIKFRKIIGFNLWNQWANQQTNQMVNQPRNLE